MDDPAWAAVPGYHHFGANYQLVNDNLLDLSHESFVHEETIGNESVAESPASRDARKATCVRVHRDMLNIEAPPFYKRTTGFTGRINRWHTNTFTPPGFHVIENGSMPAGARDKSQALERKVLNLITPETTTIVALFLGRRAPVPPATITALDEIIREGIVRTFDQDKADPGGTAARDRARPRQRHVSGLDPGRRRPDPGPQASRQHGCARGVGGGE